MMGGMQLATPQTHTQPAVRATDKRLTSVSSSSFTSSSATSTPMKAGGKTSSKLIHYPPEHFGLDSVIPRDSFISALFAWQKQSGAADSRIVCSPVWGNKDTAKLLVPSKQILIFVRTSSSTTASSRRLFLKAVFVGYAGVESMKRVDISPDQTRPLPVPSQPDRGSWYYIPFLDKTDIRDIRLDFECSNLATEVVIVRAQKLLDVINRKEKDPSYGAVGTPASTETKTVKACAPAEGDEISDMKTLKRRMEVDMMETSRLLAETRNGCKTSDAPH